MWATFSVPEELTHQRLRFLFYCDKQNSILWKVFGKYRVCTDANTWLAKIAFILVFDILLMWDTSHTTTQQFPPDIPVAC